MRRALHHALVGVALTVLGIALTYGPLVLTGPAAPGWFPDLGVVETAAYRTALGVLGTALLLAVSVGAGYREQRRHGVGSEYRRFAGAVGTGGAAVVVLVAAALSVTASSGSGSLPILAATVLSTVVSVLLAALVAALAGVSLAVLDTGWRRADAPFGRPLAVPVGAAAIAGGSVAVDGATNLLLSAGELGVPGWLPAFGAVGETVSVYSSIDAALAAVVLVGGGVGLGVYAARRHGFDESARRFVVLAAVGSAVGVTAVPATVALAGLDGLFYGFSAFGVATLASAYVETGVLAVLAAVAGLGVAIFEAERSDGRNEAGADAGTRDDEPAGFDAERGSDLSPAGETVR